MGPECRVLEERAGVQLSRVIPNPEGHTMGRHVTWGDGGAGHNGQLEDENWISPGASGNAPLRVGNSGGPEEKGAFA